MNNFDFSTEHFKLNSTLDSRDLKVTVMSTVTAKDITIRQWQQDDVKYLMEFAEENEWDLSTYDHLAYARIDPNYLLVAVDSAGQPVGFCGVSEHTPDIVYFGNFIVRKDLRGRGIGRLLWQAFLQKAGDKNVVLDGGSEMEKWYKTHGFPFHAFKVYFHHVNVTAEMKKSIDTKYDTVTLREDTWPALIEYDRKVYPKFDRTKLLRAWFTGDDVRVVVAMDAGKVVGYGSIHKKPNASNRYGIRNVFGDNEEVINAILHDMLSPLPVGTMASFMLVEDKHLPTYVQHSDKVEESALRMFSKAKIEMNTDRMWFASAHMV